MECDTDRLPQLDEDPADFIETIVLDEADVMETREMRVLIDPDAATSPSENDTGEDGS